MAKKSERRAMTRIIGESRLLFTLHFSLLTPHFSLLKPPCRLHLRFAIAWDNAAPVRDDAAAGTV
jgi:hypothetical protein